MAINDVVVDTSPLINLAGIGLLDLLPRLYASVLVPVQVATEYHVRISPSEPKLATVVGLHIVDPVQIDPLLPALGQGEAAVLSLGIANGIQLVLLDEKKARRVALGVGLQPIGTLAVLLRAKNRGLIPALAPLLAIMEAQGRRFSDSLLQQALRDAGE